MNSIKPFQITREFRAPRTLLWAVQTQAEHLKNWLSPQGFHTIHVEIDFRVGGRYFYGIEGPHGMHMWGLQEYKEIDPELKLVHLQSFSNKDGGLSHHPMAPTWPAYMYVTSTFQDSSSGGTIYTISWEPHESDEVGIATFDGARAGMQIGFDGTFAKLDQYLIELQGR
jgi:uncharacterized protein YndB with AHSA1/START domain